MYVTHIFQIHCFGRGTDEVVAKEIKKSKGMKGKNEQKRKETVRQQGAKKHLLAIQETTPM